MGFVVERTNSRKEEPKRNPGPSQVSVTPLDDVFANDHANQKSSAQLVKWKTLALAMGFCVLVLVVIIAVLLWHDRTLAVPAPLGPVDDQPSGTPDDDVPPPNESRFVERVAWGAEPPNKSVPRLGLPVRYVIISETSTVSCKTQTECTLRVRRAQTFDKESLDWDDIGCNFMIGGDGYVYVGRGWDAVGEGLNEYNSISIGITFIGTFNDVEPSSIQLEAAEQLIKFGVDEGKIDPDYRLLGLRQISRNQNPGRELYNIIKKCHHWSSEP